MVLEPGGELLPAFADVREAGEVGHGVSCARNLLDLCLGSGLVFQHMQRSQSSYGLAPVFP